MSRFPAAHISQPIEAIPVHFQMFCVHESLLNTYSLMVRLTSVRVMCFVNSEKTFDNVKHNKVQETLKTMKVDGKDSRLISNIYWNESVKVMIDKKLLKEIEICKSTRQNASYRQVQYFEHIFRCAMSMQ